ncbi:sulfotransferase family protein [Nostoc sp. KVJ3]|uniref:sulfotransferase-like domain-containing protein n=1 Tax=Nostoc sp. KVJ3 TaxID=457945 RepID=UPI002237E3D2|nr:sulfotransferase family protein [Nostoc sp. KVJ3]
MPTKQKIVASWSAPRCVSTAFEKTFSQRPDTKIVHEPFTDCYYFSKWRKSERYGEHENLREYGSAKAIQHIQSNVAPLVFFKELAFQGLYYINTEFLSSIINTFIVRHPEEIFASLYTLKPDFTEEEFGFTALDNIWIIVTEELGQEPIVVEANDFRRHPETILRRYCDRIKVEFIPQMLSWENGQLKQWQSYEVESQVKWHKTLESSTGILRPPKKDKVNIPSKHKMLYHRALNVYEKLSHFKL